MFLFLVLFYQSVNFHIHHFHHIIRSNKFYSLSETYDPKEDFEMDAMAAGLDIGELEFMDPDTRAEVLEEAGLDPDDYDFD